MKICIVSDFFIPHYNGGGERRYYEIAKRMVEMGHSVDLICMKIHGVNSTETIDGINVHHVGPTIKKPPYRNLFDFIYFIFAAFWWIIKHEYDIIDAQTYAPLIPGFLAAKIKGIKVVGTIHDVSSLGNDQWMIFPGLASLLENILIKLPFDRIITISNNTKSLLINNFKIDSENIEIIFGGVDLDLINSIDDKNRINNSIIFVGRLAKHKHLDDLLRAVKILKNEKLDLNLIVVGDGIEKTNMKKLAHNLNIDKNVFFMGNLDNYGEVIKNIKRSEILVLPSTREGFGLVLAEANACEIPVIAYDSGGVSEIIKDNINGFLIEPRNIQKLSSKIEYLINNKKIAEKMGKSGRKIVEESFNWDIISQKIEIVYKSLLE